MDAPMERPRIRLSPAAHATWRRAARKAGPGVSIGTLMEALAERRILLIALEPEIQRRSSEIQTKRASRPGPRKRKKNR